jgi:release factor glutamine methyltransferase
MMNPEKRKIKIKGQVETEPEIEYITSQTKRSGIESTEFNGMKLDVFPDVYFPHEDSFLLAEASKKYAFGKVLDLGCGTGISGICSSLNPKTSHITFADLTNSALEDAKLNVVNNKIQENNPNLKLSFIQTNLFSNLKSQKFDTICFNPPYLPTTRNEKLSGELNDAFDGGLTGRKIIDKFLPEFGKYLSPNGILLYLDSSLTGTEKTIKYLKEHDFTYEKTSSQKFFFEELSVLKINRRK